MAKNTGQTSDRTDPLHNAREAIKMGDTQTAVTRLASKRHDRMTDDEKDLLVVAVRAVYLEKQLARHIKAAQEDRVISLVEAAGILALCREYMSLIPDNPKVQKLSSQCRAVIARKQGGGDSPPGGVLTAVTAVRYLEDSTSVDLDEFQAIDEEAAQVLSHHPEQLYLGSVTSLSAAAATALARHTGSLILSGLTTLEEDVATALAQHGGDDLDLSGVTTITPETARAMARYRGEISLDGIAELSPAAAEALALHAGPKLSLDGLHELPDEVARHLAGFKGDLSLWGLKALSETAALALAKHRGSLKLYRLEAPSAQVCAALESKSSPLSVNTVISPRIHALFEIANRAGPTECLSILWERDGDADWERRERLSKDEHPDIPGGYGGPLDRPALARWEIEKQDDRWSLNVDVIEVDGDFPLADLEQEAQRILDAAPCGIPVAVTVDSRSPGTDAECEFFWGDEQGYQEWTGDGDGEDEEDDDDEATTDDSTQPVP